MKSPYCLLALLFCIVGCGPSEGKLSGVVMFGDKPIPAGMITFCPADESKNSVACNVDSNGRFQVTLPIGDSKVCFDNREFEPQAATLPVTLPGANLSPEAQKALAESAERNKKEAQAASARYVKIPAKYYVVETSGLTVTVAGPEQSTEIKLSAE